MKKSEIEKLKELNKRHDALVAGKDYDTEEANELERRMKWEWKQIKKEWKKRRRR